MPRESKPQKSSRAVQIVEMLEKRMPEAKIALEYRSELELLVAVMLSAQCTDAVVNTVTPALFARFPTAQAYASSSPAQLEKLIMLGLGHPALDPGDVEVHAAVRAAAALADLAHDAAGDVIAREQFRRPPRALVTLGVAPAFLLVVGGLGLVEIGNVLEEKPPAFLVEQHATFAAHRLGDQDALHAGRPDHPGRVELHELHVHQLGARVICERVTVAGIFPAIAGDPISLSDSPGGEHEGARLEEVEQTLLAVISEGGGDAVAVLDQGRYRAFHVHVDPLVDPVILQRADHLQAGPVADVRQARIPMSTEVALQDPPVVGAVEERAPRLQFVHARRRFLGVQFGHAPVVDVLAAAHGVGEMDLPAVAFVHVGQRSRDSAFGHHGVSLAEE